MSRTRSAACVLILAAHCLASCGDDLAPIAIEPWAPAQVRQWDLFEVTARLDVEPANPFDPEELSLELELVGPNDLRHSVPGFYYQRYQRQLVGGFERLTAVGPPVWKARFAPPLGGSWRFRLSARSGERIGATPWSTVEVTPAGRHGLVGVCPRDHRYLCFDDGAPYFAVGENLAWYGPAGTYDYDRWLERLAANGVNYARLWMPSWAFGLEWVERDDGKELVGSSLGDYRTRLGRAWQLDYVIDRARELGIHVMLNLQNHGPFSEAFNSEWADNPYSAANGGPLSRPEDFFTDAEAKALFKRRLRYVVSRWACSDAVIAWELWNEVDLTEQRDAGILVDWHEEMAAEIRRLDPLKRLLTTSVFVLGDILGLDDALFAMRAMDLAQVHRYADLMGPDPDFTRVVPELVAAAAIHHKPVLLAELGADAKGAAETVEADPKGIAFHDILWTGLFSGSAGTGMAWYWDGAVDPQGWYSHFGPIAALVKDVRFQDEAFVLDRPVAVAAGRTLTAAALKGKTTILAWVKNARHHWKAGGDPTLIEHATVTLAGIPDGRWAVEWVDPYGQIQHPPSEASTSGGGLTIEAPPFAMDLALRLRSGGTH